MKKHIKNGIVISLIGIGSLLPFEANKAYAPNFDYETLETKIQNAALEKIDLPRWTTEGRFLRASRFKKYFEAAEQKYGLPKDLLMSIAMHESYGEPITINYSGKDRSDGGAGLFQFQPGTARAYGLNIYTDSKALSADFEHGSRLIDLLGKYKLGNISEYELMKLDERFDPEKSSLAAAAYLAYNKERFKDWDLALDAYNKGTPKNKKSEYVQNINKNKEIINSYSIR